MLTPQQRELARHALGLPRADKIRRSYRNRFYASPGSHDWWRWAMMAAKGYANTKPPSDNLQCFWLTYHGAVLALYPRETLDVEDFPDRALMRKLKAEKKLNEAAYVGT